MPRRQAQERPSRLKTRLQTPTSIFTVKLPALPHRETASPATSSRVRACHAGAPPHKGILPPVTPLVLGTRRFGPTRIRQPPEASPAAPPAPCRCPPPAVSFFTAFRRRAHPTSAAVTRGLAATCPAQVLAGPRRAPSRRGSESRAIAAGRSHGVALRKHGPAPLLECQGRDKSRERARTSRVAPVDTCRRSTVAPQNSLSEILECCAATRVPQLRVTGRSRGRKSPSPSCPSPPASPTTTTHTPAHPRVVARRRVVASALWACCSTGWLRVGATGPGHQAQCGALLPSAPPEVPTALEGSPATFVHYQLWPSKGRPSAIKEACRVRVSSLSSASTAPPGGPWRRSLLAHTQRLDRAAAPGEAGPDPAQSARRGRPRSV